jgi:hypothetical protein
LIATASNNGFVSNFAYTLGWESKEDPTSVVGGVLTLQKLRTDDPRIGVKVPTSAVPAPLSAKPDKFETAIAESAEDLPLHETTGNGHHHVAPVFETGDAAINYARQRYQQYAQERGSAKKKSRVA